MANSSKRWTLENLVDFEQVVAAADNSPAAKSAALAASRGLSGAAARRAGFRAWLNETDGSQGGRKFSSALSLVGAGLAFVMFLSGISASLGMMDRARGGINVSLFIAILIGGQWLILILTAVAWLMRRRAADGFSRVQSVAGKIARFLAGNRDDAWWNRLMDGGGAPRAAVLWRLARMTQAAGVFFNLGILAGLSGLVLVRHIGFFWETTTELAMHSLLEKGVKFFSVPWSSWWPGAVPDASIIDSSRWFPGRASGIPPGSSAWWEFLLMTTLVWGLLPRAILWIFAWHLGRQSLDKLDFQSRSHRALWREITGTDRVESDEKPLDGVLVLDVGGGGLTELALRPFFLRRLRVNPAAWQSVAVLDPGAEAEAARALAQAPAGVVLLAEGWSLSPARMIALHAKVRSSAGMDTPIKFLVANVGPAREPAVTTNEERQEWTRFVDSLRDPAAEIYFYENAQAFL